MDSTIIAEVFTPDEKKALVNTPHLGECKSYGYGKILIPAGSTDYAVPISGDFFFMSTSQPLTVKINTDTVLDVERFAGVAEDGMSSFEFTTDEDLPAPIIEFVTFTKEA